jgi:hypothetical protein
MPEKLNCSGPTNENLSPAIRFADIGRLWINLAFDIPFLPPLSARFLIAGPCQSQGHQPRGVQNAKRQSGLESGIGLFFHNFESYHHADSAFHVFGEMALEEYEKVLQGWAVTVR